jgi:hypothetical protein
MAAFPARDRDAFMAHWTKILGDQTVVAMTAIVDGCVAGTVGCWTQDGERRVGYWIGKESSSLFSYRKGCYSSQSLIEFLQSEAGSCP